MVGIWCLSYDSRARVRRMDMCVWVFLGHVYGLWPSGSVSAYLFAKVA